MTGFVVNVINMQSYRTSIVLGTAIPLLLFLVWNAVILGTITSLEIGSDKMIDPLEQLRSSNGAVGVCSLYDSKSFLKHHV